METLTVAAVPTCDNKEDEPLRRKEPYRLLQEAKRTRIIVQQCIAESARYVYHCSPTTGHNAYASRFSSPMQPREVDPTLCARAIKTGKWTFEGYKESRHGPEIRPNNWTGEQDVKMNSTLYARVDVAGYTYNSWNDVHCEGAKQHLPDYHVDSSVQMVRVDNWKVSIYTKEATIDAGGKILVTRDQLELPCDLDKQECVTQEHGTFLWKEPKGEAELCPYFEAREVQGVEVPNDNEDGQMGGSTVFVSTDEYMLRLKVVGRPVSRCGAIVYQTNYPNFVLTKDMDHPLFKRKLHVSEFSILSYVNMQDEFVYHELMDSVEEVAERFRQERCQSKAVEKNTALARRAAEQRAVVDGQTAHLGAGQFITASGEVWYSYHCRKVLVQAVVPPGGSCYTALPVQLSESDLAIREAAVGKTTGHLFLEPRTRRITSVAGPLNCNHPQAPIYQNYLGQFVTYKGNHFFMAPAPRVLETVTAQDIMAGGGRRKELKFHDGGTYSYADSVSMEEFNHAPRKSQAFERAVSGDKEERNFYQPSPPASSIFDDLPDTEDFGLLSILNRLWGYVILYGELCSIVVATGLLIKCFTWILGVILRLYTTPSTPSICLHVLSAFFPALGEYLTKGSHWRGPFSLCFGCLLGRHHPQPVPPYQAEQEMIPPAQAQA
jgi:hypothetical protein